VAAREAFRTPRDLTSSRASVVVAAAVFAAVLTALTTLVVACRAVAAHAVVEARTGDPLLAVLTCDASRRVLMAAITGVAAVAPRLLVAGRTGDRVRTVFKQIFAME